MYNVYLQTMIKHKRILLIALLLVAGSAAAFGKYPLSGEGRKNVISGLIVLSSERDSLLDTNHAVFELHFDPSLLSDSRDIELSCNGVIERFTLDSTLTKTIFVSPGNYSFFVKVRSKLYLDIQRQQIDIQPGYHTKVAVHLRRMIKHTTQGQDEPIIHYRKPVIYLYPQQDQEVNVQLQPKGDFTFTYPVYENGWKGTAHPDGSITVDGNTYPYLFWEGKGDGFPQLRDYDNGFVVQRSEVTTFLEEQLTEMGLNTKEQTDFITYWGPIMAQAPRGYAQFVFNQQYDAIAALDIQPTPQHVFRVYLLWTPIHDNLKLHPKPQQLEHIDRTGFYAIEWGGSELSPIQTIEL